jgi:phage terminase large subunit-like protein
MARNRPSAATVIAWIERFCRTPEGARRGQPLELAEFQKAFIRLIYDNSRVTRRAILSMARKGGKSSLIAALTLAHLCGPAAIPNSQLYSCAMSRDQSGIIFDIMVKMIEMSVELSAAIQVRKAVKMLHCRELGTVYKALSSDVPTAHGLAPQFCIFDELGRCRGPRCELYETMETGASTLEDPLSIVISTVGMMSDDFMNLLVDDALAGHNPRVVIQMHAAPSDLDPYSEAALLAANPAAGVFQNLAELIDEAAWAERMSSFRVTYKNQVLNQRVENVGGVEFVTADIWTMNGGAPHDLRHCRNYGGLDLSSTRDLTCLMAVGLDPVDGFYNVRPHFWLPEDDLAGRSLHDRQLYDEWYANGYLELTPGASINDDYIARRIFEIDEELRFVAIAFDRAYMRYLTPCLERAGFPSHVLAEKFRGFGQGFISMAPAIRALESLLLQRRLRHGNHPALLAHAANAAVEVDAAGNRKFNKKHSRARIDGLVSLAMAVGVVPLAQTRVFDARALIG